MRLAFVVAFVFATLAIPRRADAWTNAQVASATARVRMEADGRFAVAYELRVRVLGGWLTELEVAGLDRPLTLDLATAPTFTTAALEPVPFEYVAEESGRFVFRFDRGRSPRVGEYVARFAYSSELPKGAIVASSDGRARYPFTFPAWAAGLDAVNIELDAPADARIDVPADGSTPPTIESTVVGSGTRFVFHRAHLPRGISWTVGFTLPMSAVPSDLRPEVARVARSASIVTSRDGRPQPTTRLVVAAFVIVAIAKRLTFARRARARGAAERPLLPIPQIASVILVLALGGLAAHSWSRFPEIAFVSLAAIVALTAERNARRTSTPRLGSFRPVTRRELRAARFDAVLDVVGPAAWFDASRVAGIVVYGVTAFALARMHLGDPADSAESVFTVPHALGLLGLLFVVAPASMVPASVGERLLRLERVARTLRMPDAHGREFGLSLVVHRDANDAPQDARLRFVSEHRAPGLVRLDVAILERAMLGGFTVSPVVLVVVRQGSEAERALVRASGSSTFRTAPGGRRARVLPLEASTMRVLERLVLEPETPHVRTRSFDRSADAAESPLHA